MAPDAHGFSRNWWWKCSFFHGRDGLRAVRLIISATLNFRFPARIFDDEHEHDDEDDLLAAPPRYDLRVPEAAFAT
jgi:hypothetical protein